MWRGITFWFSFIRCACPSKWYTEVESCKCIGSATSTAHGYIKMHICMCGIHVSITVTKSIPWISWRKVCPFEMSMLFLFWKNLYYIYLNCSIFFGNFAFQSLPLVLYFAQRSTHSLFLLLYFFEHPVTQFNSHKIFCWS